MKRCAKCGEAKPPEAFGRDEQKPDGFNSRCRSCRATAARQARQADPEKSREAGRRYRREYPEKARAAELRWQAKHPEKVRDNHHRWRATNRKAVFDHYGWFCACCGATDRLTIDHVNGDGAQHRTRDGIHSGSATHHWLVKNGFPEGFQTLCLPCNRSKGDGPRCQLDHANPARRTVHQRRISA